MPKKVQTTVQVSEQVKSLNRARLFATPWAVAYHAPPSMGFSRQECWSGLPFPSPGILPTQESNPGLLHRRKTLYRLSHQGSQNYCTVALNSHDSKVVLKILQARLQQHMSRENSDVQVGFRKSRGNRDRIANIFWIIEKAREFQKNTYLESRLWGDVSNLRYADDTTLMAESEQKLKSLLMKAKESEKADLKLNIQKTKIVAFGPITSWQRKEEKVESVIDFIFLGFKITSVTAAMKLKDACSLEENL